MSLRGKILYDQNLTWEINYVLDLLLKPLSDDGTLTLQAQFLDTPQLLNYTNKKDKHLHARILVFTSNLVSFQDLRPLLIGFKPHAILHFSDEWGTKPEFDELTNYTNLVLRQHWFPKVYKPNTRIFPVPLGFMTGFPFKSLDVTPMSKRKLSWSFIGAINTPRRNMITTLQTTLPSSCSHFVAGGGIPIMKLADYYNDAMFVPSERGCVRLDCFRLYEATLCGAIPVVVGSRDEIEETFVHDYEEEKEHPRLPPWLFAQTWEEAAQAMQILIEQEDKAELQNMQTANLKWFFERTDLASRRVSMSIR
jgi:hypothetical protein